MYKQIMIENKNDNKLNFIIESRTVFKYNYFNNILMFY